INNEDQYLMWPTHPVQPPRNTVHSQTLHLLQAPPYTDVPPVYIELYHLNVVHPGAATVPTRSAAFPDASLYLPMAQSVVVGVGSMYPPGSTVSVGQGYDAGASCGAGTTAGKHPSSTSWMHSQENENGTNCPINKFKT
uniref:DAZ-associated protein 2 n=1 Tax=Oryctolagus cuniculus TaxID=9986 RepID=A0A5F9CEV4_RABIT